MRCPNRCDLVSHEMTLILGFFFPCGIWWRTIPTIVWSG